MFSLLSLCCCSFLAWFLLLSAGTALCKIHLGRGTVGSSGCGVGTERHRPLPGPVELAETGTGHFVAACHAALPCSSLLPDPHHFGPVRRVWGYLTDALAGSRGKAVRVRTQ